MAMDAISRAEDGTDVANWRSLELGYAVDQLTKATNYCADAIAAMNHEMNGRDEGKPTELIDPNVPAPGPERTRGY